MPRDNLDFDQTASDLRKLIGHRIALNFSFADRGSPFVAYAGWLTRIDSYFGDSPTPLLHTLVIRDDPGDERSWKDAKLGCFVLTRTHFIASGDQWHGGVNDRENSPVAIVSFPHPVWGG